MTDSQQVVLCRVGSEGGEQRQAELKGAFPLIKSDLCECPLNITILLDEFDKAPNITAMTDWLHHHHDLFLGIACLPGLIHHCEEGEKHSFLLDYVLVKIWLHRLVPILRPERQCSLLTSCGLSKFVLNLLQK